MAYDIMFSRKALIRAALEETYLSDASPAESDTILDAFNIQFNPDAAARQQNPVADQYFGNPGDYRGQNQAELSFSSFVSPASAPDEKPSVDLLLQVAGHAVSINQGTDVIYNPVQQQLASATFYLFMRDRLHKMGGARGSFSISGTVGEIISASAQLKGFPLSMPDSIQFPQSPRPPKPCVMQSQSAAFTLDGVALDVVSFEFSGGQDASPLLTSNRTEVVIRNRAPVLTVTVIEPPKSILDYHALAQRDCTNDNPIAAQLQFPGFSIEAGNCQIGQVQEGDHEGVSAITIPLMLRRTNGNDDYIIRSKGGQ